MARIHLTLGWLSRQREGDPAVIYCNKDADAAASARDEALASGEALLVDSFILINPHTRYAPPSIVLKPAKAKTAKPSPKTKELQAENARLLEQLSAVTSERDEALAQIEQLTAPV